MRIHSLNCGSLHPDGGPALWGHDHFICRCLLVELDEHLVLIDTGIGTGDVADPSGRLGDEFVAMTHPSLDASEAAVQRLSALGYDAADLTDLVLTHHDRDHVGGLTDFGGVRVHATRALIDAVEHPTTTRDRERYRPRQWPSVVRWVPSGSWDHEWRGAPAARLDGLSDRLRFVDLPGHSTGHAGVAIDTGGRWVLHAGDAYFHRSQLDTDAAVPPGVAAFVEATEADRTARTATEQRLREWATHDDLVLMCAHDPGEPLGLLDLD